MTAAPAVCPKPRRAGATFSSFLELDPLTGVLVLLTRSPAAAAFLFSSASLSLIFLASSSSLILSYPNRLTLSSSSRALRWASSKLIPPTAFFAPSLDDLGAAPAVVEVDSRDETAGRAEPGVAPARRADEVTVRDAGLAPMDGGGAADLGAVEAAAAFGFSLSHVEKKSSAGSGLGVAVPRGVSSSPSM